MPRFTETKKNKSYEALVSEYSEMADLVIMGFSLEKLTQEEGNFFKSFGKEKKLLFVRAEQKIAISENNQ